TLYQTYFPPRGRSRIDFWNIYLIQVCLVGGALASSATRRGWIALASDLIHSRLYCCNWLGWRTRSEPIAVNSHESAVPGFRKIRAAETQGLNARLIG